MGSLPGTASEATLSIVNYPPSRLSGPSLLHLLVQPSSYSHGHPAIDFMAANGDRTTFTYAAMHQAADALAARITSLVGPEAGSASFIVPVLLPQCPELYVALLAVLKSGGAFCPLNLDIPFERAKLILNDVAAKVVITISELADRIPKDGQVVLLLDAPDMSTESEAGPRQRLPLPSDLAYVMYTSGSTGTPKGVGVTHEAVTQSLLGHNAHIPEFSRFLQFAAPTFDVSVFEIFFPLMRGKTLVSCDRSTMLNDLPYVLRTLDVDACELTPSVAGSLLRNRSNAPNMRLLLTIGEMLTEPVIKEFGGGPGQPSILWAMYGPTEAAIHCTAQPAFGCNEPVGTIGLPFDTVSTFVVKAAGTSASEPDSKTFEVLPRGEIGELAIGGYQIAREYINRPDQTAAAFIESPYGRLYRTGDKARIRSDSTLECLGRIDFGQVKLRGQRVELGEVEHAALRTPGCHSAFAVIISNILVLFCAVDDIDDMEARITQSCRDWLPGFMVPGDIVLAKDFPRLASGKIDRKLLAATYHATDVENQQTIDFADDLERRICEIAGEILAADVFPSSDLTKLGMDSLAAIRLAARLRGHGTDVSGTDILLSRTVSSLRTEVLHKQEPRTTKGDDVSRSFDIEVLSRQYPFLLRRLNDIETVVPSTPLQESMLAETIAHQSAYCNWVELSFPATCSLSSIRSWFFKLAAENEILRTGFLHHEGQFLQIVFRHLDESQVELRVAGSETRNFELSEAWDFLKPLRIQLSESAVILQFHHAVYDGWSLDLLLSDLEGLVRGESRVPHRPPFRHVSCHLASAASNDGYDVAKEFWAQHLAGFQPTSLPCLLPELASQSRTVHSAYISFGQNPSYIRDRLRSYDFNTHVLFQSALAWVWSALVGTDDVVIGVVTSGRTLAVSGIEAVIGPCISAVPIRTILANARTIGDLLTDVQTTTRSALPHSQLPLAEIKRSIGVRPGQSLYDVLFVYQESLASEEKLAGAIQEVDRQDYLETQLLVEIEPGREDVTCRVTWHSETFASHHAAAIAQAIIAAASFMLENIGSELGAVQGAFPANLLSVNNHPPKSFSRIPDLSHAVEHMVLQNPEAEALCFAQQISRDSISTTTLTYGGLNTLANRIAWYLREQGAQQGDVLAIIMDKSILLYAGILAILKAGCAYLPLLPDTPGARILDIVRQAKPRFCLVDTQTKTELGPDFPCRLVDLHCGDLETYSSSNLNAPADPSRVAYIIFTSGSTGVPKGVCVTQLNIVSNLDVLSRIYPVKEGSRLLQSCSQAFDVSVFEIFFAWTRGMCLCSTTNDMLFEDLERSIRKLNITHLSMTPTVASLVSPANVPKVQFLVTAGEPMTETVAQNWAGLLYQGYGPSETTNICSVKKMEAGQNIRHLGWAFENTSAVVLYPESENPVPFGCFGELCFGGDQVAAGYLDQPNLTSAKFIDHPRLGRLYRSGDLGRMLPDGSLLITGRVDEQIKVRGQRVELGEIASILRQSKSVVDCATMPVNQGPSASPRIITFVTLTPTRGSLFQAAELDTQVKQTVHELFQLLLSRLPNYMVPSFLVPVSMLPTTASGKLDRTRLEAMFASLGREYLASLSPETIAGTDSGPLSPIEKQLASVVSDIFDVQLDDVGRWTPLTTLGLDSLSAIEVSKRIERAFGKRLAISSILQNGSVARLTPLLSAPEPVQTVSPAELLPLSVKKEIHEKFLTRDVRVKTILPCMPLQEAMVVSSSGTKSYLNQMVFEIVADLNRLKAAWLAICARHDILRTCFAKTPDSRYPLVQVVLERWEPPWLDLDAPDRNFEDSLSLHLDTISPVIDSMEPIVSLAVVRQPGGPLLSFVCHHALYDGVAIQRLLFEVEQQLCGIPFSPPPAYADFLAQALSAPGDTDSFWADHLAGFEPKLVAQLTFTDATGEPTLVAQGVSTPLSSVNSKLKHLGVTLLSLSQAAWASTVSLLLRSPDVCFGNIVGGRSVAVDRVDELVAPCFNTVPIRQNISGKRNIDVIKSFQSLTPEILRHQFTPLRRIQSLFQSRGGGRLFDTLLLLQQPARKLDDSVWRLLRDDGDMDVPVVCELIPDTDKDVLTVKLHVQGRKLSRGIADLILNLFLHSFESCLLFPATAIPTPETLPWSFRTELEVVPSLKTSVLARATNGTGSESWTATELTVRDVLSNMSSLDALRIHRGTTIYQLGLDSINAVQIASILRQYGYDVSASDVIQHPTCEGLAYHIDKQSELPSDVTSIFYAAGFQADVSSHLEKQGIPLQAIETVLPCTPLQEGMVAQFIKSDEKDYLNFISYEIFEDIDAASLVRGWNAAIATYPILRTGFAPVIHDFCSFAMVQYKRDAFDAPVTTLDSWDDQAPTDCHKWRGAVSSRIVQRFSKGAWGVAIEQTSAGCLMHLGIHHAIYDALSIQVILRGVIEAAKGGALKPPPALQKVIDDIFAQISLFTETSERFWTEKAQRTVINKFPIMTPLLEETRSIMVESKTASESLRTLEQAAARANVTLQSVFQAAWTRILSSYLGEPSVVFGAVLSGRTTAVTRDAVFPCITTMPIVSTNTLSNRDLLDQMQSYNAELYKQQHQPLTRIQQWLGRPGERLFDTLLSYQKFDTQTVATQPWRVIDDIPTIDIPVSLEIEPQSDGTLRYQITFFSDILPGQQARILLEQFEATVRHLCLYPEEDEVDLFKHSPEIFSVLSADIPELPSPVGLLHQFVEAQAATNQNGIALRFVHAFDGAAAVEEEWTYAELNDNGSKIANALAGSVVVGDIVAIDFDKCPEAFFSILGILKAGCAFVALDPNAPAARKEFILNDSGASVLLTSSTRIQELGYNPPIPVLGVDRDFLLRNSPNPPVLDRPIEPSDVCYCLYTSGTTGTPKGCEITHENAVQCMLAFQNIFEGHWDKNSRWLQFASLHFDVSVLEQYWSWSVGITVVGAPRDLILEDLAGTISRLEITHIDLTPSLARLLHPDDVPSLCRGVFITGGETLKQEILDVWGSKAVIYNFYGPTEATIGVTVYPRVPINGRSSNIGRQFVNVGSYVLRPGTEHPVLKGAVGELCVSGKLVGKGYLNRGELTSERFPTLEGFHERVYRTGDLVRVLHDGCFDFLGRADDQVKLRGQRLEIGEINHAMKTGVMEIKDVATLVIRMEDQQKEFLVSFIVADTGENHRGVPGAQPSIVKSPEASDLCHRARQECRTRLPGYMVPTYILQLSSIPLSPNNKAEIKQLRELFCSLSPDQLVVLSNRPDRLSDGLTQMRSTIAKALSTAFVIEPSSILPSSTIFELGVDSISVIRLSTALKDAGMTQATPGIILKHPTIEDLAHVLSKTPSHSSTDASVAAARQLVQACAHRHRLYVCRELGISTDHIEYIAPCSPLQQGMVSRSSDGAYFNKFIFRLSDCVSTARLNQAWRAVMLEFPILRTAFVNTVDGCVQVALKTMELPWEESVVDTQDEVLGAVKNKAADWVARNQESITRPWEVIVLEHRETIPAQRSMLLHIFHGLYDAHSLGLILDAVASHCFEASTASEPLKEETVSFLEALCHGPLCDLNGSRQFWLEHLNNATETAHFVVTSANNIVHTVSRSTNFPESFRTRLGITHQAVLQAAWALVLSKHHGVDTTFGVITAGRSLNLAGADSVVGPLFNALPFQSRIYSQPDSDPILESCARYCHDFNAAVLDFQHVSLRDIQKWCSGGKPLFDTLFSFHVERGDSTTLARQTLWDEDQSDFQPDYPLALEATLGPDDQLQLLLVGCGIQSGDELLRELMDGLEECLDVMSRNTKLPAALQPIVQNGSLTSHSNSGAVKTREHLETGCKTPEKIFTWTESAVALRQEIAVLAGVSSETVTESTSILELGLDSIDVIKLSARLKARGLKLTGGQLMKAGSLSNMVHLASQAGDTQPLRNGDSCLRETQAALRKYLQQKGHDLRGVEMVLPATPLQDAMVAGMLQSDFQLYFNHDVLEVAPDTDLDRLEAAWNTVISASPILRTTFVAIESPDFDYGFCQVVNSEPCHYVDEVSLQNLADMNKVMGDATYKARQGNGESGLLQLTFVHIGDRDFLVLSLAHALYDGWSLGLLHRDVEAAYNQQYEPRPGYFDHLEHSILKPDETASEFWTGFLDGARPTLLPEEEPSEHGGMSVQRCEANSAFNAPDVRYFCKRHAITLQALGQACWAALLASKAKSLDVMFGVVLSGRDSEVSQTLMFPTMNTVAVRSILHGKVAGWLQYMQENLTNVSTRQHFPLRKAQKCAGRTDGPLFNTLFMQQISSDVPGHLLRSVDGSASVEYPVCVEMEVVGERLVWRTACQERYIPAEEAIQLPKQLDAILGFLLGSEDADVLSFSGHTVSVCGLAPFTPNFPTGSITSAPSVTQDTPEQNSWSPEETALRSAVAEISGVSAAAIRKTDSIYHLGIDSISAIKVFAKLKTQGFLVRNLSSAKTMRLSELAKNVNRLKETKGQVVVHETKNQPEKRRTDAESVKDSESPTDSGFDEVVQNEGLALEPDLRGVGIEERLQMANISIWEVETVMPATPMQVHTLSVWQNTGGVVFDNEFVLVWEGKLTGDVAFDAWETLRKQLPILRTTFVATDTTEIPIVQVVLQHQISPYVEVTCDETLDVVRVRIHHALYDAFSWAMIKRQLAALCRGEKIRVNTEDQNHQMQRLVRIQRSPEVSLKCKEFWTSYMSKKKFTTLRRQPQNSDAILRRSRLPGLKFSSDCSGLVDLCSRYGVSLTAGFMAIFAHCLSRQTEPPASRSYLLGVYLANRVNEEDMTKVTIPLLNMLPVRVKVPAHDHLPGIMLQVHQDLVRISEYATAGMWEINKWTGCKVDCYVNFVPPETTAEHEGEPGFSDVPEAAKNVGGVSSEREWMVPPELAGNLVKNVYQDQLDVEVAIRGSKIHVEAFGPEELMQPLRDHRLDEHLKASLDSLCQGS
ncbi:non-ribosomal peptide synthetase [Echria macrotheca]|uniref:Non-ribosomal peptide synthetase n=1 Tax=Echria macrotheca TaxID=438768 RepID=A0AAJ0FFK1_9PEZI|nr:non-ribosomal peptide synthetase [Echria macrotheca]